MRLILFSTPSLATDALRLSLLASQAFARVDVASDAAALAAQLHEGCEGAIVDDELFASLAPELAEQLANLPIVHIALHDRHHASRAVAAEAQRDTSVAAVIARLWSQTAAPAPSSQAGRRLSRREAQVLGHLANGMTNREIAALLAISIKTVDTHRGQLLKKLGLRNNSDLTRFALQHGITPASRQGSPVAT